MTYVVKIEDRHGRHENGRHHDNGDGRLDGSDFPSSYRSDSRELRQGDTSDHATDNPVMFTLASQPVWP